MIWKIYVPSARKQTHHHVRNVDVWAVLVPDDWHGTIRSPLIESRCLFGSHVDARYNGPRSAYGRALANAQSFVQKQQQNTGKVCL